jgi:hypothetical protein
MTSQIAQEASRRWTEESKADTLRRQAFIAGAEWQRVWDAQIARSMADNEGDGYYGQACYEVAAAIQASASAEPDVSQRVGD